MPIYICPNCNTVFTHEPDECPTCRLLSNPAGSKITLPATYPGQLARITDIEPPDGYEEVKSPGAFKIPFSTDGLYLTSDDVKILNDFFAHQYVSHANLPLHILIDKISRIANQ